MVVLEFRAQNLLYAVVVLYPVHHDESLCADTRTGEGVEAWRLLSWRLHGGSTDNHDYLPLC